MNDFLEYANSDVIIVGGGPCGTTAAMVLAREGVKTLIIEKDVKAGGGMWQGGIFVSASLQEKEPEACEVKPVQEPQQICGPATCNQQCGGACGIPRCGCR